MTKINYDEIIEEMAKAIYVNISNPSFKRPWENSCWIDQDKFRRVAEAVLQAFLKMWPEIEELKDRAHHLNMIHGIRAGFEPQQFTAELYLQLLEMRKKDV